MARISVKVIACANPSQRDSHVARLLSEGFVVVHHDSQTDIVLAATQRFGTEQWMAVFYGLVVLIVPAVIYVLWWFSKPVPVVIVRLAASDDA